MSAAVLAPTRVCAKKHLVKPLPFRSRGRSGPCSTEQLARSAVVAHSAATFYGTLESPASAQIMLNSVSLAVAGFIAYYMTRQPQVSSAQFGPRAKYVFPFSRIAFIKPFSFFKSELFVKRGPVVMALSRAPRATHALRSLSRVERPLAAQERRGALVVFL